LGFQTSLILFANWNPNIFFWLRHCWVWSDSFLALEVKSPPFYSARLRVATQGILCLFSRNYWVQYVSSTSGGCRMVVDQPSIVAWVQGLPARQFSRSICKLHLPFGLLSSVFIWGLVSLVGCRLLGILHDF